MGTSKPTGADILAVAIEPRRAKAKTIREYLVALARAVWVEGEGFSGKRPFGDSGWEAEVYEALAAAGLIPGGGYDEDGYTYWEFDRSAMKLGDKLISLALDALATPQE